ncbi:hypothetical protein Esti_001721 [Eimeria stiedai]
MAAAAISSSTSQQQHFPAAATFNSSSSSNQKQQQQRSAAAAISGNSWIRKQGLKTAACKCMHKTILMGPHTCTRTHAYAAAGAPFNEEWEEEGRQSTKDRFNTKDESNELLKQRLRRHSKALPPPFPSPAEAGGPSASSASLVTERGPPRSSIECWGVPCLTRSEGRGADKEFRWGGGQRQISMRLSQERHHRRRLHAKELNGVPFQQHQASSAVVTFRCSCWRRMFEERESDLGSNKVIADEVKDELHANRRGWPGPQRHRPSPSLRPQEEEGEARVEARAGEGSSLLGRRAQEESCQKSLVAWREAPVDSRGKKPQRSLPGGRHVARVGAQAKRHPGKKSEVQKYSKEESGGLCHDAHITPCTTKSILLQPSTSKRGAAQAALMGDSLWFFLFTHCAVLALASLQIALCLTPEWGGGFSFSSLTAVQFFNLHPLLNILAFGVAMTESLVSFRAFNLRHRGAKRLHALLHLSSLILGILAFTVVVLFHNANEYPNFYSVHSWLGLSTYILAWSQFIAGFCVFWLPNCAPPSFRASFLRYHKVGGLIVYIMAIAAAATGLMQKQSFLRKNTPSAPLFGKANLLANAAAVLAVVTSCAVLGSLATGHVSGVRSAYLQRGLPGASQPTDSPAQAVASISPGTLRGRTPSRQQMT